jgi:glucosylceramidase
VNVYNVWNMVLDTFGKNLDSVRPWPQNALLTVDTSAKTVNLIPAYYVFRHVSQYVDPGAKVVGTTGGDALAFKNPDGTLVAIVHNTGTSSKAMIVAIGGKKLQFTVPANGFATVNPQ